MKIDSIFNDKEKQLIENRNSKSEEIYEELVKQGERKDIAYHLSRILKTPFQQQAMMKYLISIRQEHVSEVEVIQIAQRISEIKNNINDEELILDGDIPTYIS